MIAAPKRKADGAAFISCEAENAAQPKIRSASFEKILLNLFTNRKK